MNGAISMKVSPSVTALAAGVVFLIVIVAAVLLFHRSSQQAATSGQTVATPAQAKMDQQFLTQVESMPAGQRGGYMMQNNDQFNEFMMTASAAQKAEFAKSMAAR